MGIRTQTVATCDKCKLIVQEGQIWVDYGTADIALHWNCIISMSAAEFIQIVHEGGDQMFIRTGMDEDEPYWAELKHLSWKTDPGNIKNALAAHKINRFNRD